MPLCTSATPTTAVSNWPRLHIASLQEAVYRYLDNGIAHSTKRAYIHTYNAGAQQPIPTSENTMLSFVAQLASHNPAHTSIKVYLSSIWNLHVTTSHHQHFAKQTTPNFRWFSQIKREQSITKPTRVRCPITADFMLRIKTILSQEPHCYIL